MDQPQQLHFQNKLADYPLWLSIIKSENRRVDSFTVVQAYTGTTFVTFESPGARLWNSRDHHMKGLLTFALEQASTAYNRINLCVQR
eukprot:1156174-Pelagomonas_calceolata.AAC.5